MKKIILSGAIIVSLLFSCQKNVLPASDAFTQKQNSSLVTDWINLQLRLVRNTTGITHVAYSRHFSYTGIALYETLVNSDPRANSIAGQLNGTLKLPTAPAGKSLLWPAAANAAMADMLRFFYGAKTSNLPIIDSMERVYDEKYASEGKNLNADLVAASGFGKQVAAAVIEWSKSDDADRAAISYTPLGEGYWEPTPAAFASPAVPGWGNNRTILPGSISGTMPPPPPVFSKNPGTPFYNMVKELYDVSQSLTNEQKEIANFWDDSPNGKYVTVYGHWFSILRQVLEKENTPLLRGAEAYLRVGIALHESSISCWKAKYTYNQLRPITYIRKYMGFPDWNSLIGTPPHPEYSAAHATLSASAAAGLGYVFGKNYSFTDHTYDALGMTARSFNSFEAAGTEAGLSRLYGGIHYRPSIEAGKNQGQQVAQKVNSLLKTNK